MIHKEVYRQRFREVTTMMFMGINLFKWLTYF